MNDRLSIAVMAHPQRREMALELGQLLEAEIVWDEGDDEWDTGARALLAASADWHLVIQDDAIAPPWLRELCLQAIACSRGHPISLYYGEPRPFEEKVQETAWRAVRAGTPWIRGPGPWWGVALLMPRHFALEAAEWGRMHSQPYDERLCRFSKTKRQEWLYTFPSFVDHRSVFESPSIYDGRNGNRRAVWFAGLEAMPLPDFNQPPVGLNDQARWQHTETRRIATARDGDPHSKRLDRSPKWERLPGVEREW